MNYKLIFLSIFIILIISTISSLNATDLNQTSEIISQNSNQNENLNLNIDKLSKEENKIITLNSTSFDTYVSNGEFNDLVSDGDTIDVNGKLDGAQFALTINKSLNFISSNNQSYINVYTKSTGDYGEATGGQITFGHGSTGSNITGLYFYNTRVVFTNTSNILVNNISVIDYEANIGSGTGHFILSGGSKNITINNSYFYTKDNGQHSTMVFTGANSCIFENNTVEAVGKVGNLVYINTFNSATDDTNGNITIRNNLINATEAEPSITCFAICIIGANHLIENNTVLYGGSCLSGIWTTADYENITIRNNNFKGSVVLSNSSGIKINSMKNMNIINNTIGTLLIASANIYNNTISTLTVTEDNSIIKGNNLKTLNIDGSNIIVNNNTISTMNDYAITVTGINNTITNNQLASSNGMGDDSINNTTTITIENNTQAQRYIYITSSNYEKYGYINGSNYCLNNSLIKEGDYININSLDIIPSYIYSNNIDNLTFFNMTNYDVIFGFACTKVNTTLLNCYLPGVSLAGSPYDYTLINSTIGWPYPINGAQKEVIPNIVLDENSKVLSHFVNNTYSLDNNMLGGTIVNRTTHLFFDNVNSTGTIQIFSYNGTDKLNPYIIVDRTLNFVGVGSFSHTTKNITFITGSSGSTVHNLNFKNWVIVNASGIKFYNSTFQKGIILNNVSDIEIDGNVFNTTETAIILNNSNENIIRGNIFIDPNKSDNTTDKLGDDEEEVSACIYLVGSSNNILTNNTIDTTKDYTIYMDDNSQNNNLTSNILSTESTKDINSVKITNTSKYTENTQPRYNTTINITLENTTTAVATPLKINITVIDEENNNVNNGYIELYVDGIFQTRANLTNGTYNNTITLTNTSSNTTIKVWYYSDELYYNSTTNISGIVVQKATVTITSPNITGKINTNTILTANITLANGYVVNEGSIKFIIGNQTIIAQVINGTATTNTTILPEWADNTRTTIQYFNTTNYVADQIRTTLTITAGDTKITSNNITTTINTNTTLTAKITDSNGKNITDGNVSFTTSNGTVLANVAVVNGTATATIVFNSSYIDNVTATYNGTKYYLSNSTKFSVMTGKLNSTITVDNVRGVVLSRVTLVARVVDENGNNVTGGTVGFKINGVTLRYTNGTIVTATLVNGVARVNYTIPQGWLATGTTIMATYTGNSYVNSARSNNSTVTITRLNSTVSIITDKVTCKTGETMIIKVLVTDSNGKLVNGGQVAFKLNGLTLKDSNGKTIYVNVTNGVATLNYTIPILYGAYNYTLTAVYGGSVYSRATDTSSVELIKTNTHVDANPIKTASNKVTINARVLDGNNKQILRATTITLKLNGITYKNNITANNGILNITLDFSYKTGTYELLIIAGENSQYQSSRLTTTIQRT